LQAIGLLGFIKIHDKLIKSWIDCHAPNCYTPFKLQRFLSCPKEFYRHLLAKLIEP